MVEYSLSGALLVGLMGAGHCFGMCGGLVGALSGQIPLDPKRNQLAEILLYQFCYNGGRILSYTLAGMLCGALAGGIGLLFSIDNYLIVLRLFAGVMMIFTGLYVARLWFGLVKVEAAGKWLWRFIQPLAQRFVPMRTPVQAIIAGILWGWLPCGLVYSMLTWSIASGNPLEGALIMAAFGVGTLPALISAGVATKNLALWLQSKAVRIISGLALIGMGIQTILVGIGQLG
ncbi:MAG: sulfite exporter TauE/SafE family protein [Shewanella sp.]|nr:sulfite exporter TauE/SafE family protein [Shewanella sp.]MCF1430348.1 sulfite exporter TauE/SafE family protein [Shewanella sp.]MCF1438095.1 sulfite exporter TauE/SafE family protein [Shewanella sp.]MCF1459323.1 sulfite exporter TauE/SafE family protein [Shewanella sp.]